MSKTDDGAGTDGGAVLIVDDDPQAREYYESLLRSHDPGRRILVAEHGGQALDILQTETPALILLDLYMPEVDGYRVLDRVRGDSRTQGVPVIITSGRLLEFEDIRRLNHRKTSFLTKGIYSGDESLDFINQIEGETRPLPQATSLLIKQVLAFLHQNYVRHITRKDIAEAVGVSENYLSQIFRHELTITPWDYLSRLRIHKAKELLRHTPNSVTWVAAQVGFNDSAYFSRVFHKLAGQSPQEFRQSAS